MMMNNYSKKERKLTKIYFNLLLIVSLLFSVGMSFGQTTIFNLSGGGAFPGRLVVNK
jgi:hypothetical protein